MAAKGNYTMADSILPSNLTTQWNNLTVASVGSSFNSSTICQGDDFLSNYVFKPAVEESLRKFLRACLPEPDMIQNSWTLCKENGSFSCSALTQYTQTIGGRMVPLSPTTPEPCTMGDIMQDDVSAILLLIGLVVIGILLGVAGTVAVCIICPGVHGWAMQKLRGEVYSKEDAVRASTVSSEYYAAIEENRNVNMIRLRPLQKLPANQNEHSPEYGNGISPSGPPVGHTDFNSSIYQQTSMPEEPVYSDTTDSGVIDFNYEGLNRTESHSQSHKYAQISSKSVDPTTPQSVDSEGHGYFTLEKVS